MKWPCRRVVGQGRSLSQRVCLQGRESLPLQFEEADEIVKLDQGLIPRGGRGDRLASHPSILAQGIRPSGRAPRSRAAP
jgi:hypothetical protein